MHRRAMRIRSDDLAVFATSVGSDDGRTERARSTPSSTSLECTVRAEGRLLGPTPRGSTKQNTSMPRERQPPPRKTRAVAQPYVHGQTTRRLEARRPLPRVAAAAELRDASCRHRSAAWSMNRAPTSAPPKGAMPLLEHLESHRHRLRLTTQSFLTALAGAVAGAAAAARRSRARRTRRTVARP